jgi:hypothetical protein
MEEQSGLTRRAKRAVRCDGKMKPTWDSTRVLGPLLLQHHDRPPSARDLGRLHTIDAAGCNGSDIGIFASAERAAKYDR